METHHQKPDIKKDYLKPEMAKIPEVKDIEINQLLSSKATSIVSRVDSLIISRLTPNLLLSLLYLKEAETTSRIEGTQVTFEDVVLGEKKSEKNTEKRTATGEALGVFLAIGRGKELIEKENLPISNRFIKEIHETLMNHAQSDTSSRGEFRNIPVNVGERYFPPEGIYVPKLMDTLEEYIHNKEINIPPIVKIAIIHAQFEIIHPFSDGNGRIGRLLISFLAREYGLTQEVSLFLSEYFGKNRSEYYNSLENITEHGRWNRWIHFFLQSTVTYGEESLKKINKLISLYTDGEFLKFQAKYSQNIKNYIFEHPIFSATEMLRKMKTDGLKITNSKNIHSVLQESKDIKIGEKGKGKRPTIYRCDAILDILKN